MSGTLTPSWNSDNSQFHVRRRACLAGKARAQNRLAVLLIEPDTDIAQDLLDALAGQPLEVRGCPDPAEALLIVGRTCPDVVILGPAETRLPAREFLRIVRADDPHLPVIVGAGPGRSDLAGQAAELGGTVVVPRPYRAAELLRILRSFAPKPEHIDLRPMTIDLGRLRIDGAVPQFHLDGRTVTLPPMEFLLLRYFAERTGSVITREELLTAIWGENSTARSNTLSVHIMRLRKRLGDDDRDPQWIKVVRRLGYQFTVPAPGKDIPEPR